MALFLYVAAHLLVVVVIAAIVARMVFGNSPRSRLLILGILLSVIRVGSLWFLQYRSWNGTMDGLGYSESFGHLRLMFLLMPEALLADLLYAWGPNASVLSIVGFSLLLISGSFLLASVVEGVERLVRRCISAGPAS